MENRRRDRLAWYVLTVILLAFMMFSAMWMFEYGQKASAALLCVASALVARQPSNPYGCQP